MRLNMRLESDDIGGIVMRASRGVDQNQVPYHPAAYHPAAYHPVSVAYHPVPVAYRPVPVAYHPLLLPTSSSCMYKASWSQFK